ncbi:MAG: response regulator transcription factor [Bacteroidetes bacterium]|nr:response regulator transcription factor [Bacteroidota bacterium]
MINTLIIEDEGLAAERLTTMVKETDPEIKIIDHFDSVQDTVAYFKNGGTADLLFMDVQLADGKSFEIFDFVEVKTPIIFTTAYDQYAMEAFKQWSIDYLLKPIQKEDLERALKKFKGMNKSESVLGEKELQALRDLLKKSTGSYKQRLMIKSGNKLQYKPVDQAAYFFADGKAAFLITRNEGHKFLIDHTLEELESILDPEQFFRISRKFIVNFSAVSELRGSVSIGIEVRLNQQTEHELAVSRERAGELKAWLDR